MVAVAGMVAVVAGAAATVAAAARAAVAADRAAPAAAAGAAGSKSRSCAPWLAAVRAARRGRGAVMKPYASVLTPACVLPARGD